MSVDIIIPYFQRSPGILVATIRSVLAQTNTDWHLIVVDDGSPHPARNELECLTDKERVNIRIIEQPNGGVSVARNRGLGAVRPDARFVAFLDSDDCWSPNHLAHAVEALQTGADIFWGQVATDGSFDTDSAPSEIIPEDQREPTDIDQVFRSDCFVRFLAGEWWRHMHLSAIVLRADAARKLRFNCDLRSSEDFDFFKRVADMRLRAAFSDAVSVTRGVGDNIWHNLDFSDQRVAQERFNTFRLLTALLSDSELTVEDKDVLQWRRNVAREQFVWSQYLRRQKGEGLNLGLIAKWLMSDPALLFTLYRLKSNPDASAQNTGIPKPDVQSDPR